jgi:hypothetical protein
MNELALGRHKGWMIVLALTVLTAICSAQDIDSSGDTLTNRDVVTLAKAGFSADFILQTIATSRTKFNASADGLAELAKNGVAEEIIWAMRRAHPASNQPRVPLDEKAAPKPENLKPVAIGSPPAGGIRVFVEASPNSWNRAQSHPQTVEIMKTLGQSCPNVVVTNHRERANFTMVVEREAGKWIRRDNKVVVFDRVGDLVYEASTHTLGNAVRGFCSSPQADALVAGTNGQPPVR